MWPAMFYFPHAAPACLPTAPEPHHLRPEVGKCTYVLVEADGDEDHERAFCPPEVEHLMVVVGIEAVGRAAGLSVNGGEEGR